MTLGEYFSTGHIIHVVNLAGADVVDAHVRGWLTESFAHHG
jgi:hypothetical protein